MRIASILTAAVTLAAACSSVTPIAVRAGDTCFRCRRTIENVRLAAEVVSTDGNTFKFRTSGCLATWLAHRDEPLRAVFVTASDTGRMIRASSATFVPAVVDDRTGERDYLAFSSVTSAIQAARTARTSPVDWPTVLVRAKLSGAN
jgi:hypothetical protein